jgi:hypothetical protein
MAGYFSFQKLITATIVKAVYFIGFLLLSAGSITLIVWAGMRLNAANIDRQLGWRYVATGAAALVVGNVAWRILCEFWIVIFNINDQLELRGATVTRIREVSEPALAERRVITPIEETTGPRSEEKIFGDRDELRIQRPANSVLGLS